MKKPKGRKKPDTELEALKSVASYLESIGWNMVVGRFSCIEQNQERNNFRLVIEFTGGRKP